MHFTPKYSAIYLFLVKLVMQVRKQHIRASIRSVSVAEIHSPARKLDFRFPIHFARHGQVEDRVGSLKHVMTCISESTKEKIIFCAIMRVEMEMVQKDSRKRNIDSLA